MTAQEQAEKLAPCPFCGGPAYKSVRQDESLWNHNIVPWTRVGCRDCDIEIESCEGAEPDAIAAWNTRTPTPPDDVRLAEIRGRAEKATPGPWTTERPKPVLELGGFLPGVIVAATGPKQAIYADPPGGSFPAADRAFIAHSRADIPYLLDRIALQDGQIKEAAELFVQKVKELSAAMQEISDRDARIATAYQAGFDDARERAGKVEKAAQQLVSLFVWEPSEDTGGITPHLDRAIPHLYDALTELRDALAAPIASAIRAIKPGDANGRKG